MAREAFIIKVNPYDLHGVRWYQLFLAYTDSPGSVSEVRLSHDVVYKEPGEGDRVQVESILSIVTEITKSQ